MTIRVDDLHAEVEHVIPNELTDSAHANDAKLVVEGTMERGGQTRKASLDREQGHARRISERP